MKVVQLNKFVPREYQIPLVEAFEEGTKKRFLVIWPRRAGKDICAFNLLIRAALRRIGSYWYVFPTFSMGRRILFDAIDIDGRKVIDYYLPEEIVESKNEQQMKIRLINGSQIQILGSDDMDKSLVGTNAAGMIFSEYALQDPRAWSLSLPILRAAKGWALFCSTVRGKNHFYDLFQAADRNPDWFCQKLTLDDTRHISHEQVEQDVKNGEMSWEIAQQEYFNDWNLGVDGSFYGRYVENMYKENRITKVKWDPYLPVYTAWDIGFSDPTCILFAQVHGSEIRIIDFYQNNKLGLEHYAKVILDKPYNYAKHFAPFDIAVHDLSTGVSRWRMMKELGISFVLYAQGDIPTIQDGIEQVRRTLPRMWIDQEVCSNVIKALENYKEDKNDKLQTFKGKPVHDKFSHIADAMRYLCYGLPRFRSSVSPEEIDRRYNEAMYNTQSHGAPIFNLGQNNRTPF